MKIVFALIITTLLSGCVVVQKTPKASVTVVDSVNMEPIADAKINRKYFNQKEFKKITTTDLKGTADISATYQVMPIPHFMLLTGMILKVEANSYQPKEVKVEGRNLNIKVELERESIQSDVSTPFARPSLTP